MENKWLWRVVLVLLWLASPLVAHFLYGAPAMFAIDSVQAAGMMTGLSAFVLLVNQILLASRPFGIDRLVGQPWFAAFHMAGAAAVIAVALVHRWIKVDLIGYPEWLQTWFGTGALILMVLASVGALALLYQGFMSKVPGVKAFRSWAAKSLGLDYKRVRVIHSLALAAPIAAAVHVWMALSTQMNPGGAAFLACWLLLALGLFLRYRIRGRKA